MYPTDTANPLTSYLEGDLDEQSLIDALKSSQMDESEHVQKKKKYNLYDDIKGSLSTYHSKFSTKTFEDKTTQTDILMDLFEITPQQKKENSQYWSRELGALWEDINNHFFSTRAPSYKQALTMGRKQICDLFSGKDAIDTKYRIGNGDQGTILKFKLYGRLLKKLGFNPVLLILRDDNLKSTITRCEKSGWTVYAGEDAFTYILENTGIDVPDYIRFFGSEFKLGA